MKGGVDQGPCLNYCHLSYRRKVIRALWHLPFLPVFYAVVYFHSTMQSRRPGWTPFLLTLPALLWLLFLACHSYRKWRQEQEGDGQG